MRTRRDEYLDLYEEIESNMIKMSEKGDLNGIINIIENNIERLNIALYEAIQNGESVSKSRKPDNLINKGINLINDNYIDRLKSLKNNNPDYLYITHI